MICEHFCELLDHCNFVFDNKIFSGFATKDIMSWAFGRGYRYYFRLDGKLYILIDDDNKKMYLRDGEITENEFNDIIVSKIYNNRCVL